MSHGEAGPLIIKIQQTCWPTPWMGKGVCAPERVCVCVCRERNCRFQGSICPWGFQRERTDDERQRAAMRGVKRKKKRRERECVCVALGYASIILPVFLCLHVCILLSMSLLLYLCVSVCVRVCAHSVKWNGRCCREYNRGPIEVASRQGSSLPLTLQLDNFQSRSPP